MSTFGTVPWRNWLEPQSYKREIVGSSPTVGKIFSFCNDRFLCVPHCSNRQMQMKSTVTYIMLIRVNGLVIRVFDQTAIVTR